MEKGEGDARRLGEFLHSGHLPTLFSAFLYFDVSFMVWVLIGVLGVSIGEEFGLSSGQRGLLVAIPILGGSLVRIPVGLLVDRIGSRKTGILGQLLVMVPLAWLWLGGESPTGLLAPGLLLGIAGGSFAVALPLAGRWYPPHLQGLAMGVAGAGTCGTVLAALAAPRLAGVVGWHGVFGLALIPTAVTLGIFARFARDAPSRPAPRPLRDYLGLCRERDMLWFCLFYGFTFGGFVGLASFLVIFFTEQYGLDRIAAGNFTALCVFSGSFARPVGGHLADRFGGTRMLSVLIAAAATGLAVLSLLPPLGAATAVLFVVMACLGMGNGSVFQLVPQRFRKEIGVATGVVGAAGGVGGFFLPSLLGYFKEATGSYGTGLLIFSLAGFLCVVLLQMVNRSWRLSWLAARANVAEPT